MLFLYKMALLVCGHCEQIAESGCIQTEVDDETKKRQRFGLAAVLVCPL